jgi:hypothetical protein
MGRNYNHEAVFPIDQVKLRLILPTSTQQTRGVLEFQIHLVLPHHIPHQAIEGSSLFGFLQ